MQFSIATADRPIIFRIRCIADNLFLPVDIFPASVKVLAPYRHHQIITVVGFRNSQGPGIVISTQNVHPIRIG